MSRMIRLFLLVAIVVLTATAVSAQKDTPSGETPPTDTIGVIDILEDGAVVESVFEGGVTAHLYAFNGTAGDLVTVSMTQSESGALDPFIVITGPSGQVVASDDDSGSLGLSSLITDSELPEDGSYFLLATSFVYINNVLVEIGEEADDQESGETYTLTISGNTQPTAMEGYDPELISFFGTTINTGESAGGESTGEFPVGYYVFAGTEGQTVNVTATGVDGFDTVLHVFSPTGERIAINDDAEVGVTFDSEVAGLELPYEGLYLVWATNLFFYNAGDKDAQNEYDGGAFTVAVE